jgi:spore germination protein
MKESNYKKLQKTLENEIKRITDHSVSILQNDFQADVIGLNKHLYERYYPFWESIKNDWEKGQNYFKNSEVHITVDATIEKPGNIIKSH